MESWPSAEDADDLEKDKNNSSAPTAPQGQPSVETSAPKPTDKKT